MGAGGSRIIWSSATETKSSIAIGEAPGSNDLLPARRV
jgi:hypothetical protein